MADLYIIAAGNGSRMNSNIPKALIPITDNEPCLTTTLKQIGSKFDHVFIINSSLVHHQWEKYWIQLNSDYPELIENTHLIEINSGLGDGHAVMHALEESEFLTTEDFSYTKQKSKSLRDTQLSNDIVIAWGDIFFQYSEIIDELLAQEMHGPGLIPAILKKDPYVSLLVNDKLECISVDFSKHGENHPTGFHDQSIFRFDRSRLKYALNNLHNALWKGRYITPGGELSLLYTFHQFYNIGDPAHVYPTDYPTLSFNTIEEVTKIQKEISTVWYQRNRKNIS